MQHDPSARRPALRDLGDDQLAALVLPVCEPTTVLGVLVCVAKAGRQFTESQLEMTCTEVRPSMMPPV